MISQEQIAAWAAEMGLAECIGVLYVQEHGHLPATLGELCEWATRTGRRTPDGQWQCTALPVEAGPGKAEQVESWITAHPIAAVAIAFAAGTVLSRRRR